MTNDPEFDYVGPPQLREAVGLALSRVINPETGRSLVHEQRVHRVRLGQKKGIVHLALADSPVARLMAQDAQDELGDQLQCRWPIVVVLVQRPVLVLSAATAGGAARRFARADPRNP
jgi:hypothetical protein